MLSEICCLALANVIHVLWVCSQVIAAAGHTVRWTSPLGLPVVQPYRKHSRHLVIVLTCIRISTL